MDTNLDDLLQKKLAKIQIYPPRLQDMFDLPVSYIPLSSTLIIDNILKYQNPQFFHQIPLPWSWEVRVDYLIRVQDCWQADMAGTLLLFRSPSIGINDLEI